MLSRMFWSQLFCDSLLVVFSFTPEGSVSTKLPWKRVCCVPWLKHLLFLNLRLVPRNVEAVMLLSPPIDSFTCFRFRLSSNKLCWWWPFELAPLWAGFSDENPGNSKLELVSSCAALLTVLRGFVPMRGLKVGLLWAVICFGVTALDLLFSLLRVKSASLSCSFFLLMKRPLVTTGV